MSNHYFGITDLGKVRDNNEDAFLVEEMAGGERILAAVIDGVGGYEGGEVAAAIAKECISELLTASLSDVPASLKATLIKTNLRIIEEKQRHPGKEKMACVLTLVLADLAANQFYYAHVGDTRLYLLRGQSLVKVSKDHSFVGFLEESNRITELNAMRHPKRNEVNKVLGLEPNIESQADYIDTGSSPFLSGDLLLLCSDGLSDMIGSQEITEILTGQGGITEKAKSLIDAANKAGGRDNVTVVLVQNPKAPQTHEPTLPTARKTEPVTTQPETPASMTKKKSSNPVVWILALLCLGLGGLAAWLYTQRAEPAQTATLPPKTENVANAPRQRGALEQQFITAIASSNDSLIIDTVTFKSPLSISDSLTIDNDTFRLAGNGLVLRGDSAMRGPAIFLAAGAKQIILENLVFENFPVAIVANGNALQLRNVRFRNCGTSVAYGFRFPDMQAVNGAIRNGGPFKTDSLAD